VIQRDEVDRHILRQLFGILMLFNLALALVQLAAAPLAAAYYREPMVADLLRAQALLYITTPFIVLAYAILSRAMDFKRQAQVNVASAMLAAVAAIGGALAGWGVWTLVWAPLVGAYARALGLTLAARSLMWPSLDFRGAGFILKFGGFILVGQLFWFVQTQADIFIIGRLYDAYMLGIYSTALFLTQIFVNKVVPPLNEVAFAAYSRIKQHEGGVAPAFLRSLQMIMVIGLPVFTGFAVTAEPLVLVVLGAKWAETIPFVVLLAIAMPLMTMITLFGPASNAIGRPDIPTRNSLAGAIILPAAFGIALYWGPIGIAYGWIAGYAVLLALAARWTLPVLGVSTRDVTRVLLPPLLACLAMAAAVLAVDHLLADPAQALRLGVLVATGVAVYAGWLLVFARPAMLEIVALVTNRR
jgi:O-antigen/teichoic acid export membrane protein